MQRDHGGGSNRTVPALPRPARAAVLVGGLLATLACGGIDPQVVNESAYVVQVQARCLAQGSMVRREWAVVCELAAPDAVPEDWERLRCSDVRTTLQRMATVDPEDRYRILKMASAEMGVPGWQCAHLETGSLPSPQEP